MKAIALIGNKKSGKTTLAEALCAALRSRGLRVGVIKYSHHGFDHQDTDTARLAAHTVAVAGIGADETMIHWPRRRSIVDIVPLLSAEVLVIEGGRDMEYVPRIVLPRENFPHERDLGLDLALASWKRSAADGLRVCADVSELADLVLAHGFFLPGLNCGACGRKGCADLAREIVSGRAGSEECQASHPAIDIRVNGNRLALNPFVESLISSGIKGMVSQLKGYAPGTIEIHMGS